MKPRSTTEETRTFILKDLTDAINLLPIEWTSADKGRATKGAAIALRGKLYLYAKDYVNASKDFHEIVDNAANTYKYALNPNYAELFTPKGDGSSEMIFAIQNMGGVTTPYGMPMGLYMGTRSSYGSCWNNFMPSNTLADMYETREGKKFNWNDFIPGFNEDATNAIKKETFIATLSSDKKKVTAYPKNYNVLVDMYTKRDPRMTQSLIVPYSTYIGWLAEKPNPCTLVLAAGTSETNGFIRNNKGWKVYVWRKFVPEANMDGLITDRSHTPINFPIIRYADVLLMLAESDNELGKQADAVKYINMVRQRPSTNLPALNSGPAWLQVTTKEEVFQRIFRKRAVELAGEGVRFSDLRRWGLAESLLKNKKEYELDGGLILTRGAFSEKDYLWPIPAAEIEKNPSLTKNPGW